MTPTRVLNGHIILEPKDLGQLQAVFPAVKIGFLQGRTICAVPLALESTRLLRNLGYDAPSPILHGYEWPSRPGLTPRPHQVETSAFFTLNPRGYCHSSMRTGKTLSTLWAIDHLQRSSAISKALIIAPLSTLERVWGDELFVNFPYKRFAVLHGSADKRKRLLDTEQDIYIVNHDGVEVIIDELMRRGDINLVVIDEAAVMRNSRTKRWRHLNRFLNSRGIECWVWGLTGTPTPNEPTDAYGQSKLITPERVKHQSFTHFKNITMMQHGPFKWVPRKGSDEIVRQVLSPSIRFTRDTVTSMEPCLIERHAELSEQQKKHLNELLKQATTEIDGAQVTAVNAAVLIQKCVQMACGVVYGVGGEFLEIDFGPRLRVLEELIEENGEGKVLVFVPFTGALDAIARELRKRWSVAVVDGGVSAGARNKIFSEFQKLTDPHVLVAHPGCMAHGLELTRADLIVWYAPFTSNEVYQQACARIDGGGQTSKIDIAHISSTPTERRIYATVREKGRLQDVVLELLKSNSRS